MKPWSEVAASPEFQALPFEQKESARNQYFNDVVMPQVKTEDLSAARAQFDLDTEIKKPTVFETVKNFGTATADIVGDALARERKRRKQEQFDQANAAGKAVVEDSYRSAGPLEVRQAEDRANALALRDESGRATIDTAGEIGRQAVAGVAVDAPKMVNQSLAWFTPDGSAINEFAKEGADYWASGEKDWAQDLEGKGVVGQTLIKGARSMAPSAMVMGAAMANPWVGGAAAATLFGGSQAEDTYERGLQKGLSKDEARKAGWLTGTIEGVGETIGDVAGARFMSGLGKRFLGEIGVKEAEKLAVSPRWAAMFAKDFLENAAIQSATEYGQGFGETAVENRYGISDESPIQQGNEGAQAALGMSVLLGGNAAIGHRQMGQMRKVAGSLLDDAAAPVEQRKEAADFVRDQMEMAGLDKAAAKSWHDGMLATIQHERAPGEQNDSGAISAADILGTAPAFTPADEQAVTSFAQKRLDALEQKANGTEDQAITGPDGKPVTVAGMPAQFLTADERDERDFLRQNIGNPAALAHAYNIKPTDQQEKNSTLAPKAADLADTRPDVPLLRGKPTEFSTETGARISADYALVPAASLITSHDTSLRPNPAYPQELQPRERDRAASETQIATIAQRLDPARLGEAADAANGAPIIGADGLVESGNARTIALKRVYSQGSDKAGAYRQYLKDSAERFGITPESVDSIENPVLVRVRNTPVNRAEFARQANASTVAQMSPTEQARSDAARIQYMDDLSPTESGDFSTSRDFIRRFVGALPETERGGMMDAGGQLSQSGYARIRNAVLAKAYGNSPALLRMVESLDDNLRNISKALMQAAPQVAKSRDGIAQGALYPIDVTQDLLHAVEELSRLRDAGISVHDALAQTSLVVEDDLRPETKALLQFLDENIRRPRRIADFIRAYVDALDAVGNPNQGSMFGSAVPTRSDLIDSARSTVNAEPTAKEFAPAFSRGEPAQESGSQSDESQSGGTGPGKSEWVAFPPESGTLGIPRAEMPQVKGDHRGALIQYLDGRGITHETLEEGESPLDSKFSRTSQTPANAVVSVSEAPKKDQPLFSRAKTTEKPSLIIHHNISAENLMHAIRMGGIPVPSLAITDKSQAIDGFGDITLIGSKAMADPKGYANTKVFGADIYSPRYPEVEYRLDSKALKKINEVLEPFQEGRPIYGSEIGRVDDLTQNDAFKAYAKSQGANTDSYHNLRPLAEQVLRNAGANERIFTGYTPSGNRRYVPHTLENVVKILKKELRAGEGFSYGVGSLRAKFTPQFKSIEQIHKAKDKLIDSASFEKVREEIDTEFFALSDKLSPHHAASNRFGFADSVISTLQDSARMGIPRALKENGFDEVPVEIQQEAAEFLAKLRNLPAKYFEAKILRDVDLSEFSGAVVPKDIKQEVIDALKSRGVNQIRYYDDRAERTKAVEELADELQAAGGGVLFSRLSQTETDYGKRIHMEDLNAVADEFRKVFPGLPIHPLEKEGHAPSTLRDQIRALGAQNDTAGALHDGGVYLFRTGIRDLAHAEEVAVHEATHYGLNGMFGPEIGPVLLDINRSNLKVQAAVAEMKRKYRDYSTVRAIEEVLADMGPRVEKLKGWDRLVAWVRDKLRQFGKVKEWTDNDVNALVLRALSAAKRGRGRMSVADVERLFEQLLAGAKNAPEIRVVEKPDAFPFPAPEDAKGAYFRGAIWIARANISSPVDLRYVVAHEVIGHYGLRGFFGPLLDGALSFIHAHNPLIRDFTAKWASNNKDVIREYKNDYGMSDEDIWYLSIEEAMAKLSEKPVNLKGLRRLAALVQQALRAMGQSEWADKLEAKTNAEALDMLRKAGLFVKSGQKYDSKKVAPLFSRLADQTLAKDLEDQEKFLNKEARARGYKSIDDLAEKAYPVFEKLAAKWRQQHPVEAALFSRGAGQDDYQYRADQLMRAFEKMGLTARRSSSRISKSEYVEVESPEYTGSEGERGETLKFRVSDHELPHRYAQPDFDVIADGVEHGGVAWNKSGTWVEAVEWLAGKWKLPAPAVIRQTKARAATQAQKDQARMKLRAVGYAQDRLDAFDAAVAAGKVTGKKTNSGAWTLNGWGVNIGAFPGESFDLNKAISRAREKLVAVVAARKLEAEGAPTPNSRELGSQALNNQDAGAVSLRADESGSPAEPAQSGGGAGSDANVPRFSRSAPPAPTSAGSQTPQARIKQWKATANSAIERMDNAVNGMGKMPDQARYLAERYLTLGRIAHIDEIAGNIRDSFSSATPADKKAIYDYLTTRGAASATIQNVGVRDQAEKTKKYIGTVGDQLVKRGLIPQESREEYRDRYLPRLYLAHLLDDSSWRAIGGGKKASDMGYLKQRNDDLPEEYRKVILGEVTDPAFLAASAIAQPMRDMAILDWLGKIVGNENWVWPKQLIEWGGRKVSAHWLQAEADSLLKRAALYESDTDRKKAEVVATEMRKKALATMADMPREHADYKRIPDTPRYGQLRGLMVRREIYDDLVGLGTGVPGDAGFAEQLLGQGGIGSKATKLWKTAKVALNPPGQIRNFISNAVMLQLSGVPLRKIPGLIVRAAKQVKHGGKHWQAAKKYGVTAATFTAQELYRSKRDMLDLEVQMKGHHPLIAIKMVASWVMDKAGDAYQFSEALMKTAKMIDAMEREGMTDEQAALEAQKWLFDYSLVNRNIRYLRNAPVGMPFLTYSAKVAPRLSEVAAKHPLRFLPWVALFYGMGAAAMAMLGGDGDDWDDLKKSLPEWLRKKPHAVPLPWRDSEGRIQFTDIGYFFPWSQWAELGKDLAHGEPMDALRSAGIIGGPVPDIITAIKTGIDPFTKKPIADPADPTWQQSVAVMNYVWSMAAPPFLTSNGFLSPMGLFDKQYGGKLVQGVTGTTDKWGDPRATTEQAFIGLAGVNINGVDPDHTRASELQRLNREALDVKAKLVRRLADRSLSEAQRAILISDYTMEMQERTKKAQEFGNSAKVPAFSRPIGGANAR